MAWKHGLFGCYANTTMSLLACMLTPLAVGKNAEAIGEKNPCLWVIAVNMLPCIGGALLRGQIRKKDVSLNVSFDVYRYIFTYILLPRALPRKA